MADSSGTPDLTPDDLENFLDRLAVGDRQSHAAAAIGVKKQAISNRKRRDPAFALKVECAEGRFERSLLDILKDAANKGNWQAAAWRLERQFPERWAKPEVQLEFQRGNEEDQEAVRAIVAEMLGHRPGLTPPQASTEANAAG